jgi:pyridoxal phosphate enzyme (YggS family)
MSEIARNIISLRQSMPASVKLVAVSKTMPASGIMEAYEAGQRAFGENRVQELLVKKDFLPSDIEWHLIGHLQRNKVKYIAPFVSMIQSADSLRLLITVNEEAEKNGRILDVLLQVHIAREETKFGFSRQEIEDMIESPEFSVLKNIKIRGLMGMASFTDNMEQVRTEFRYLASVYKDLKDGYFASFSGFNELSMGMSGDYRIAISEGSTIVRIGSLIFGKRSLP